MRADSFRALPDVGGAMKTSRVGIAENGPSAGAAPLPVESSPGSNERDVTSNGSESSDGGGTGRRVIVGRLRATCVSWKLGGGGGGSAVLMIFLSGVIGLLYLLLQNMNGDPQGGANVRLVPKA